MIATFLLVALGGSVTSHDAGLSVPDWPTTYGYNMFGVPWDLWLFKGGAFLEHSHRLKGSFVGVLTILAAVWLWAASRDAASRRWLRWLGVAALALVIFQGVLGGLRVIWHPATPSGALSLAMAHGITGQVFLCVTVLIAAATSRWWTAPFEPATTYTVSAIDAARTRRACAVLLGVLLLQLVLGVLVRHTNATAAIPDFPASFGSLVPPLQQQAIIDATNRLLPYDQQPDAYATPVQVALHFAHRLGAVIVLAVTVVGLTAVTRSSDHAAAPTRLRRPALALAMLLIVQLGLGASIIWSAQMRAQADIATAHQVIGAAILATAFLLTVRAWRLLPGSIKTVNAATRATLETSPA